MLGFYFTAKEMLVNEHMTANLRFDWKGHTIQIKGDPNMNRVIYSLLKWH